MGRNPDLAALELAWTASVAASWTFQVAALVVAYRIAGPPGVGAVGLARTLPAILAAPLVVLLERRFAGRRLLVLVHATRMLLTLVIGLGVVIGVPSAALLIAVAAEAAAGVFVRPTTFGLVPALATAPAELVAANVAATTGEGIGTLVGPVIGGFVVATAGPVAACTATFAILLVALAAAWLVRVPEDAVVRPIAASPIGAVRAGGAALREHPAALLIVGSLFAQVVVRGALSVLLVVASIELLGLGDSGVGVLNGAIGLGGFVGVVVALSAAGLRRLSIPFAVALACWSLPIAIVGVAPTAVLAVPVLVVVGASNATLDVTAFTLLQRLVPNAQRTAVFGLLESVAAAGMAIGSVAAPLVLAVAGTRGAMVAFGLLLPIVAVAAWPRLAHVEREVVIPERELSLLRSLPIFAPLPMTVIERLAGHLIRVEFGPGEELMRQGDEADCFYAIETGEAEIVADGRVLRSVGPGTAVGEIGLLRRVPRTATVRAVAPTVAFALPGEQFVAAVTGNPASRSATEGLISNRLAFRPRPDATPPADSIANDRQVATNAGEPDAEDAAANA